MSGKPGFKPKKSVALSGVQAGNTALCTVGRTGNDLHYRGYDILDLAETSEFEEIAHLLVHQELPTRAQLAAYKTKLKGLRGLPQSVKLTLEAIPAAAHPMDVMRSGVSAMGCVLPEPHEHNAPDARDVADRLLATLGSILLYWYHFAHHGRRIDVETDDDSIGGHFLHLLHGEKPRESWVRAMHTSLILYAEHEFNASTFTARVCASTLSDLHSCVTGAIGSLRGPLHGGANEAAMAMIEHWRSPEEAEREILGMLERREKIMGLGHRVYKVKDPRANILQGLAGELFESYGSTPIYDIAVTLGIPRGTVKSRLQRARLALRGVLERAGA